MARSEVGVVLPTSRASVERRDPKLLILYGPPKVGKTSLVSMLDNNLILDLEEGGEYVENMRVSVIGWAAPSKEDPDAKASRLEEEKYYMNEVGKAIIDNGRPYDYITIDTGSKLEEMVKPEALRLYRETPMGKNFDGDIITLPRGGGYYYLRKAFMESLEKIKKLAPNIILIGHLKDTFVDKKGKEVLARDLAFTGQIKNIVCADADAIGYLYREEEGALNINFKSSDKVICGARQAHLRGKDFKIADYDEETDSLVNVRWDLIYPDTVVK